MIPKIVNIRIPIEAPPTHQSALRVLKNKSGKMFIGKMSTSDAVLWKKSFLLLLLKWTPKEPLSGPLRVSVNFGYPLLKKHQEKIKKNKSNGVMVVEAKVTRPDCDNLVKSVLDALTEAKYIVDDSNVVSLSVSKWFHWKAPFIDVIITEEKSDPWRGVDTPHDEPVEPKQ
jgi:Holliday junction resolvase RusA-like endonuclease